MKGEIMSESEAQRRATIAYRKKHTKSMTLTFYPSDMELLEFLEDSSEPKAAHIKRLIAAEKRQLEQGK